MSHQSTPKAPIRLRCEYIENPLGIDNPHPKLSWILDHDEPNQYQTAYQIIVYRIGHDNFAECVWDTGQVASNQSVNVRYEGRSLESGQRYSWRVRWWDANGNVSPYSEP